MLYVDDMLIVGHDSSKIDRFRELSKSFAMKNLGPARQILGMKISRDRQNGKLWLSQEVEKMLERFNMSKAKQNQSLLHLQANLHSVPISVLQVRKIKKKFNLMHQRLEV